MRAHMSKYLAVLSGIGLFGVFALLGTNLLAQRRFEPVKVVPPFKPITEVPVKSVKDAQGDLNPAELVLGVTIGKEARAYPINMLTGPSREILNDTLGGTAIAATW
jgi:hypothetical protein